MKIKQFEIYRQQEIMDCGPICLKMILGYFGKEISLEDLREAVKKVSTGTSLLGISQAAEKYGFSTVSTKSTIEQLLVHAPLPCILHWNRNHFVVLMPATSKRKLIVADPAKGMVFYTKKEFLKYWALISENGEKKGIALFLSPEQ